MENAPLFSVIIPVYNVEDFIVPCLESLVNQTDPCFEALIIDDGSPDGSAAAAAGFAAKDPARFRLFHKPNGGPGDARNFGLERARGEYVIFLDGDDRLTADACEKLRACIEEHGPDLLVYKYRRLYPDGHAADEEPFKGASRFLDGRDYLACPFASPCTKVMRRSVYMDNHIRFPVGMFYEDLAIVGSYVNWADKIYYLNEALYLYIQREGSTMRPAELPPYAMDRIKALEMLESSLDSEKYGAEIEYQYIYHILYLLVPFLMGYKGWKRPASVCAYLDGKFPRWKDNKYYRREDRIARMSGFLLRHRLFFLYRCFVNGIEALRRLRARE